MPSLLISKPVEMKKLILVVQNEFVDNVVSLLEDLEALHIEKISEKAEEYLALYNKVLSVMDKIKDIMSRMPGVAIDIEISRLDYETLTLDRIEEEVNTIYRVLQSLIDEKNRYVNIINKLEEARLVLTHLPRDLSLGWLNYTGTHVSTLTIYGKQDLLKNLLASFKEINVIYTNYYGENIVSIVVFSRVIRSRVEETVKNHGLKILDVDVLIKHYGLEIGISELLNVLDKDISKYSKEVEVIEDKIRDLVKKHIKDLAKYITILENKYGEVLAIAGFLKKKYLSVIKGWIPIDKIDSLLSRLKERNIAVYYEIKDPVKGIDNPPTLMRNPKVLEWFEPVVKFIGIPSYWEWDPTPVFAISFSLFFGLMLGDIGYAVALILAVLFILDKFVKDPFNKDYVFFKKSLLLSSIIGLVIGSLLGSLFGLPIHSYLGDPSNPGFMQSFLAVALVIGLVHVNIGHSLGLIKALKNRSIGDLLSEIGLFISETFGIPYILYRFIGIDLFNLPGETYSVFMYLSLIGITMIIAGSLKVYGGLGGLLWIFNVTGLMGDVLSYSRLAGVGLATFYLAQSFNGLAKMAYSGMAHSLPLIGAIAGALVALIILVFGHFLNTVLSAIGCYVHSLRLCFIEFLTKFYEGSGYLFEPLRIVTRRRIFLE